MTITGPIYSRSATNGANTVRAYNRFTYKNIATINAEGMNKFPREGVFDEEDKIFKSVYVGSGTTVVVSGVTDYAIEVCDYNLVASGATVLTFLSGSTNIGKMSLAANDNISAFEALRTANGDALSINLTGSVVSGHLTYKLV